MPLPDLRAPKRIDVSKPVMQFFEDGDWLRIEAQGKETRYLKKTLAKMMLVQIGQHSVAEKSDLIV